MNKIVKLDRQKDSAPILVEKLSHDGRGIGVVEGKTTFIQGALPGETVTYRFTQKRGQYNEAIALDILTPSSGRVTPPCQHFGLCGGCSLQYMDADTQLALKQQTLLEQLKHFGQVTPLDLLPPLTAGLTGYRRKARLGAKFVIKKDKMLVGFREKSSRYLADLDLCEVLHPRIGQHFSALKTVLRDLEAYQHIPQVEVAMGDQDLALVFRHLQTLSSTDKEKLLQFGKQYDYHIYLQPNAPEPIQKIWPQDHQAFLTYTLPENNLTFLFHPLDFTQINLDMNRLMVKQAIALLDISPTEHVLDLFCGIGNFTLPLAQSAAFVTGIEGGSEMVERAKRNADYNHITNVDFHASNLFEPNTQVSWMKQHYDKILLDPPRAGAQEILPYFNTFGAKKIVYVSCNPATLARDAGELVNTHGYTLKQAGVMNMFPHTAHIEAMAVFEKE